MSGVEGIDQEVLERYVRARKAIGKHADRVTALVHLLGLLRYCPEDSIQVNPMALAVVADLVDSDICSIQEQLDEFIFQGDAEEAMEEE